MCLIIIGKVLLFYWYPPMLPSRQALRFCPLTIWMLSMTSPLPTAMWVKVLCLVNQPQVWQVSLCDVKKRHNCDCIKVSIILRGVQMLGYWKKLEMSLLGWVATRLKCRHSFAKWLLTFCRLDFLVSRGQQVHVYCRRHAANDIPKVSATSFVKCY